MFLGLLLTKEWIDFHLYFQLGRRTTETLMLLEIDPFRIVPIICKPLHSYTHSHTGVIAPIPIEGCALDHLRKDKDPKLCTRDSCISSIGKPLETSL